VIGSDIWSNEPGFQAAISASGITGICGSGIIEAIAEMRIAGLVDAAGLIGSAAQTGTGVSAARRQRHGWAGDHSDADGRSRHSTCKISPLRGRAVADGPIGR